MSSCNFAVLGGTFDPVHFGHLAVAQLAREYLKVPRVYFIPAGTVPHTYKTVATCARHRLAMLRRAVTGMKECRVLDTEIRRSGPSYTIDTLNYLRGRFGCTRIFFIVGSDNLKDIPSWKSFREILRQVHLCIAHRPGYSLRLPPQIADAETCILPSPEWGISSSMIRTYLDRGYSCRHLVPESVLDYARHHRIYGSPGRENTHEPESRY
jgi:nicotinate-nucleotide adenylyltransferase